MSLVKTCYSCDNPGTTIEHVPPKCIFPDKKYLPKGMKDLRKNLITVPSCEEHNTSKSSDDEYFGCLLSASADSALAFHLFSAKWHKALLDGKSNVLKTVLKDNKQVILPDGNDTISFRVDMKRIERVLVAMSKGLYYHENKGKKVIGGE
jgi:hypothetical protein